MKPRRISAWRIYGSLVGALSGVFPGIATMFSNVLKKGSTAITVFALFATKNTPSLSRKFREMVALAINLKKCPLGPESGPQARGSSLSNSRSTVRSCASIRASSWV